MCYDTLTLTKRSLDYAKRVGYDQETMRELEEEFEKLKRTQQPLFHVSGFQHPALPVVTQWERPQLQTMIWGLVPFWVKSQDQAEDIWNKTLNARGETIFKKPAFRAAARKSRCLIVVDGFYEHHHFRGQTYPFLIQNKNYEPLLLGGICESWENEGSGKIWQTVSIVTTGGNKLMSKIHNNPKVKGSRMPLLIPEGSENIWLQPIEDKADQEQVESLIEPYPDDELKAHTVARLRGKDAIGNVPEATKAVSYPELEEQQGELF